MSVVPVWAARRSMARESSRVAAPSSRPHRTWLWMSTIGASWDFGIGVVRGRRADDGHSQVFGNGTRFVWYGGDTQEEDAMERALTVEMKAGHAGRAGSG